MTLAQEKGRCEYLSHEEDLIRAFRRLIDLCRQLAESPELPDDLRTTLREAVKMLDRGIVLESERMEGVDRIWLPGEMEYHTIRERLKSGIPLPPAVVDELKQLAGALNLSDRLE